MMPRFRSILFIFRGSKRERNKTEKGKRTRFPLPAGRKHSARQTIGKTGIQGIISTQRMTGVVHGAGPPPKFNYIESNNWSDGVRMRGTRGNRGSYRFPREIWRRWP